MLGSAPLPLSLVRVSANLTSKLIDLFVRQLSFLYQHSILAVARRIFKPKRATAWALSSTDEVSSLTAAAREGYGSKSWHSTIDSRACAFHQVCPRYDDVGQA